MPRTTTKTTAATRLSVDAAVALALGTLKRQGSRAGREAMARYAIPSDRAFGVAMRDIQALAKRLGRDHDLAGALWATERYEARLLAAYIDEPDRVTTAQMDRWCDDFDNWAVCDTACFVLFDKAPGAWAMVTRWARRKDEFQKRAAFALLWGLAGHDRTADDRAFLEGLTLIERAADDDRRYVKKAVSMALRAIGKRRPALIPAVVATATRLAASNQPAAQWVGRDALRTFARATPRRRPRR